MARILLLVSAIVFGFVIPSQAATRYTAWGTMYITPHHHKAVHHRAVRRHHVHHAARHIVRYHLVHETAHAYSGLIPELATKAAEIVSSCASHVISTIRHGAVIAGSGRPSLHRDGRAVDIQGNPSCIYAHLSGWRGGYSVDYSAVRHVHVSLGGREDGARFVHGGGHHHRYAYRHVHRRWS